MRAIVPSQRNPQSNQPVGGRIHNALAPYAGSASFTATAATVKDFAHRMFPL